jgi:hypothetical protein
LLTLRAHLRRPQVHGFPKVMGVLTHLDAFRDAKRLKKTKKTLKHRFWAEIYQGTLLWVPSHAHCYHDAFGQVPAAVLLHGLSEH